VIGGVEVSNLGRCNSKSWLCGSLLKNGLYM